MGREKKEGGKWKRTENLPLPLPIQSWVVVVWDMMNEAPGKLPGKENSQENKFWDRKEGPQGVAPKEMLLCVSC